MTGEFDFPLPVPARRLAGAWFVLALLALGASALLAVVLVAARTPFLGLGGGFFRTALVLHVDMAVLVWFLAAAAGLWVLTRGKSDAAGWGAFCLSAVAVLLMLFSPLLGGPPPVLSNYAPVLDSTVFLGALAAFFVGVLLTAGWSLSAGWGRGAAPWRLASRWSVLVLGVATFVFVRDCFFAPITRAVVPITFDDQVWGAGHLLQFMHGVLMIGVWSVLGQRLLLRAPRLAIALPFLLAAAAAPTLIGGLLSLLHNVGSSEHRWGFTELMRWASWPAAAVCGLGFLLGAWRMVRAGDPLNAEERVLLLSVVLFLAGCLVGATIHGNATTSVPAHYHGTVGAVTLAYLLFARGLAAAFGLRLPVRTWIDRLPLLYGCGIGVLVIGLAWSGMLGVPRKAPHTELAQAGMSYLVAMGLAGVGGFVALAAAAILVVVILRALWRGLGERPAVTGKRDVRARALLATLAVVLLGGLLLGADESWLPRGSRAKAHVAEKKRAEIDQRFQQGVVMLHAKQYDHALTSFHRVLELAPEMPEAYVNAGFALLGKGEFSAAADFFDEATGLRRDQINAYYGLAVALEGMGNMRGAIEAMRTYLHRAPANDPYRVKAEAALWEWQEAIQTALPASTPAAKAANKH
jgi:Tfp pilus assembly protein PilF